MTRDLLLQLSYGAMSPERVRRLVNDVGADRAVRGIEQGRLKCSNDVRSAVSVPAELRWGELAKNGVRFVIPGDVGYPEGLAFLPDAPMGLFIRGADLSATGVAVVGARKASAYGLGIAQSIGHRIALSGWPVVSGLAAGVDAAAHRGCLAGKGRVIAVLGSGIDVWYPARNRPLGAAILAAGGSVVSEFPPGTTPEPWRFPCRNRIISGLAGIVIVAEAALRSGALITARLALDQGREVVAVPGDIDRETSAGCNLLIRDGAHPLVNLDELVDTVAYVLGKPPAESVVEPVMGGVLGPVPTAIDDLAVALGRDAARLMCELSLLEAEGRVVISEGMVRAV